jgi:ribosomal protein S1
LVGKTLTGLVIEPPDVQPGVVVVSPRRFAVEYFRAALDSGRRVAGLVVRANRGGIVVEVDGVEGFVPRSELRRRENRDRHSLVGKRWQGRVLSVTPKDQVLTSRSPRQIARRAGRRARFLAGLRPGDMRRGTVRYMTDANTFIRLDRSGIDALVPRDNLAARLERGHPGPAGRAGDRVWVRITQIRPGTKEREADIAASYVGHTWLGRIQRRWMPWRGPRLEIARPGDGRP